MNFLNNNWAQISFILLALGYIIKVILDSNFKKKEIKYNFYLNNRMKAIETFLSNYTNLEASFSDNSTSYFYQNLTAKEIDAIIVPLRYKLVDSLSLLQLYTTEDEFKKFTDIESNFSLLMNKASRLKYAAGLNEMERNNELYGILRENRILNEKLLKELVKQIQSDTFK